MRIIDGTRMVQTRENMKNGTYTLYNNRIGEAIEINYDGYKIIKKSIKKGQLIKGGKYTEIFISKLQKMGFVENKTGNKDYGNIYISDTCKYKYPLTALSIELVNVCNLGCIHCYGQFNNNIEKKYISLQLIKSLYPDLNRLQTLRIALTGGEVTTHPEFVDIAMFFLKKGFEVTILTNGYNYYIIEKLLKISTDYHFLIKVSLDGTEKVHNQIRQKKDAFEKTLKTLKLIEAYSNVDCVVSTAVMKQNVDNIPELKTYVETHFPRFLQTFDFVFPAGNAKSNAFSIEELNSIIKQYPHIYQNGNADTSGYYRCTGGISQCTLTYEGKLKLCNSAEYDIFYFSKNVFDTGLLYAWIHCGKNIREFRHERSHTTKDCEVCQYKLSCANVDCRVMAYIYTGDSTRSNPITCAATKRENSRE